MLIRGLRSLGFVWPAFVAMVLLIGIGLALTLDTLARDLVLAGLVVVGLVSVAIAMVQVGRAQEALERATEELRDACRELDNIQAHPRGK